MLNDEIIIKQLSDLEEEVERQATHLKDSMGFFEQMSRDLLTAEERIVKLERAVTGPGEVRRNCLNCGRLVKTVTGRCEHCGRAHGRVHPA